MGMAKIKKGDNVVVLSGKDKGKTGTVAKVLPKDGKVGGIDRYEAPMHIAKVAVADPKDGAPTRVRIEERDGKKVRVAVKSGETIDG